MLRKSSSSVFWLCILLGIPFYLWLWSIGTKLQNNAQERSGLKLLLFKISILYPITYFVFAIFNLHSGGDFIMPLHFSAMISTLYAILFSAKTLKSAELNREAFISDYLGDFFLLWFFPIGIWIIQPKINKMVEIEPDK